MTIIPSSRSLTTLPIALLLLILLVVSTSTSTSAARANEQNLLKRHDLEDNDRPQISFAAAPNSPPALVKSEYNQFAVPPSAPHGKKHHGKKHGGKKEKEEGVSRGRFVQLMHKIGLHPNKHQIDRLYGLVKVVKGKHHKKKHHGKKAKAKHHADKSSGEAKPPVWTEVQPPPPSQARLQVDDAHAHSVDEHKKGVDGEKGGQPGQLMRPNVGVGVLPPGLGEPRGWGDEGGSSPSPPTKNTSPISAAQPPLPEPANTFLPAATGSSSAAGGHSNILPPLPAAGIAAQNNSHAPLAPATSVPSIAPSSSASTNPASEEASGTSGSLNPSSTPTPVSRTNNMGGDTRLTPLANGTESGQNIAGVPIADDGDLKVPQPQNATSTSGSGKQGATGAKSGGTSNRVKVEGWSWAGAITVAGVLVGVLFFAI
ncbi:uncharacterized protein UTRI_05271 [Ustilago trichophora]|uniref:Uncharacterized protein n=1 Tax=Ustilago trichophora TaxID=86804 RepID=A0A5C3EJ23_9BASI|nr:uncharacterized protein UTRI_05271 [Ustilago trichophora]